MECVGGLLRGSYLAIGRHRKIKAEAVWHASEYYSVAHVQAENNHHEVRMRTRNDKQFVLVWAALLVLLVVVLWLKVPLG